MMAVETKSLLSFTALFLRYFICNILVENSIFIFIHNFFQVPRILTMDNTFKCEKRITFIWLLSIHFLLLQLFPKSFLFLFLFSFFFLLFILYFLFIIYSIINLAMTVMLGSFIIWSSPFSLIFFTVAACDTYLRS